MKIKKYFQLVVDVWHTNKKFFFSPLTILTVFFLFFLIVVTLVELQDVMYFIRGGFWDSAWIRLERAINGFIFVTLWYGLSLVFYPFMKFWFKNTSFFRNRYPKLSLKNHISLYRSISKKIDETTPDDVHISGTISNYGVTNLNTRYSRDTANCYKHELPERYFLYFFVYPLFMYLVLYLLTPIIMWFIMPKIIKQLQEDGIEGY